MTKEMIENIAVLLPEQSQVDALNSEDFRRDSSAALAGEGRAILDLSRINFIDSSGLGVILGLVREMHERGGKIILCGAKPPVQALFRMVRMANIVEITDNRTAALAALNA